MTVIVDYRTGGREENKDVECYWEVATTYT